MAGEDVRYMAKPNPALLAALDGVVIAVSFIPLMLFFFIFAGDFPIGMKISFSLLAGCAIAGILHLTVGTRRYVVTDQRLLVIANFTHDVHDSCELQDITSVTRPKYLRSLFVERAQGKPVRLWALDDIPAAMNALNVGQLKPVDQQITQDDDQQQQQ